MACSTYKMAWKDKKVKMLEKIKLIILSLLSIFIEVKENKPIKINVFVEDEVDKNFINASLYFVPNLWTFSFIAERPKYLELGGFWKDFLVSEEDNTMVIFDGALRDNKYAGGCVGKSVGIARNRFENDPLVFGLRIWHELLHAQHIDADAMIRCPEFEDWLEPQFSSVLKDNKAAFEHSMQYQILFYNFLTWKLIKR